MTKILLVGCGENASQQERNDRTYDRDKRNERSEAQSADFGLESGSEESVEKWFSGESIGKYLGGAYYPDNPFVFQQEGDEITTENGEMRR